MQVTCAGVWAPWIFSARPPRSQPHGSHSSLAGPSSLTASTSPETQEAFVGDLVRAAYAYTTERKRKTMSLLDLGDTIKNIPRFEFLDAPGPRLLSPVKRERESCFIE